MASPAPRRRLPAEARRAWMLDQAAEAFAAHGFAITTREIARRMGVTQALIYKYFPSKEALIEAVLEARFLQREDGPDADALTGDGALADRLARFYAAFTEPRDDVNLRLFLRAALDGLDFPTRYRVRLDPVYMRPVVAALRREVGAPELGDGDLLAAEREIALQLHGALVFARIRASLYRRPSALSPAEATALRIRLFAVGAVVEMRRLHGDGPAPERP